MEYHSVGGLSYILCVNKRIYKDRNLTFLGKKYSGLVGAEKDRRDEKLGQTESYGWE